MDNPLLIIVFLFRALALSQVLMLVVYLLLFERHRLGLVMALAAFSFCCYLAMPMLYQAGIPTALPDLFASSIPAIVWILARVFFEDDRTIPVPFWLLWLGYMLLWMPDFRATHDLGMLGDALFLYLPQFIKLGMVLHVIVMAIRGRETDLVNQRLKLRVPVALGAGSLSAVVIAIEILSRDTVPLAIDAFGAIAFFVICLITNLYLFTLRNQLSFAMEPVTAEAIPDAQATLAQEIRQRVADERLYAEHGTTIGDLADKMGLPAYKVRAAINQGLGHRNFNQFLNSYRIEEASRRLKEEASLPVLTIALDVGFKSLSSFNKSFRDVHSCTPTEFRQKT